MKELRIPVRKTAANSHQSNHAGKNRKGHLTRDAGRRNHRHHTIMLTVTVDLESGSNENQV